MRQPKREKVNEPEGEILFGYARVSTQEQNLEMQIQALIKRGVPENMIFTDKASGSKYKNREGLRSALKALRPGSKLVVWKLDRLGRSVYDAIEISKIIYQKGAGFECLTQPIDTTTSAGRLMFNMLASMAEFERDQGVDRTRAGLENARAKGKVLGKPSPMKDEKFFRRVVGLVVGGMSLPEAAGKVGKSRSWIYLHKDAIDREVAVIEAKKLKPSRKTRGK